LRHAAPSDAFAFVVLRNLLKFTIGKKRAESALANTRGILLFYGVGMAAGRYNFVSKENRLDTLHHAAIRVKDVKETVEWYTKRFRCEVEYQDASWAMLAFENVRLAFVIAEQHPPHIAIAGDPGAFGEPKTHRDGTSSVYVKDPNGNNVEVMAAAVETAPVVKE
jgi:hypothetical protein